MVGLAQSSLPEDARYDTLVPLVTQDGGESLRSMVEALALSIGLTPVVDKVPEEVVYYGIVDPKPFRQIWSIVISENNLDYALLDNDVMVVGPPESVMSFKQPAMPVMVTPVETMTTDEMAETFLRFYRVNNNPVDVATLIRQAIPGIEVSGIEGVSSISVVGTQEQQDEVKRVLGQFDTAVEQEPLEQRVYNLSYAKAVELATVLQESGIEQQTTGEGEGAGEAMPTFKVVANESTNSIVVTATAAVQARIAEIVPSLDVAQRQINVQVRIQEISTTAAEDLGIDINAGLGNFATNILDGGLKFVFDAQRALSGLNIGAVLDTLERQDLSRRVDDGNLTVLNNQTGQMQSGGTIFIFIAGQGSDTNIERVIEYGVKLEVTPRITSDGRITMEIVAEFQEPVSELTDPSIFELDTRRVTSTVTLESGQTVLLGGLFQNNFQSNVKRIPVLGSIPIVGSLFTDTSNEETNTELLVIVNANIVE